MRSPFRAGPMFVVQHDAVAPLGHFAAAFAVNNVPVTTIRTWEGDELPHVDAVDRVLVLGGHMGAYDTDVHPVLADEKRWFRALVGRNIPVLGICLGAQLLADSLGGSAYKSSVGVEVSYSALADVPGRSNPLPGKVLIFHQDTFDIPADATLLVVTERFPQVFRHGSALGVQPHPEATPDVVARWFELADRKYSDDADQPPDELIAAMEADVDTARRNAQTFITRWLASG